MHWKIVPFFRSQLKKISKIYRFIDRDFEEFQQVCHPALGVDLGRGIYKFRCKNSSIPTGKRWGFRIIMKIVWENAIPLLIYSKTHIENISDEDIIDALEQVLKEL